MVTKVTSSVTDSFKGTLNGYGEKTTTVTVSTSTYNIDLTLSNVFDITLNSSCTFTFINPAPSGTLQPVTVILRQGTGGNKTATFVNAKYTEGQVVPLSTIAGQIDVMSFFTVNGGSFWFGTFAMANVS
jgi:hypothetical protein